MGDPSSNDSLSSFEKAFLAELSQDKKAARRLSYFKWGMAGFIFLAYMGMAASKLQDLEVAKPTEPYVSLVRLTGEIGPEHDASAASLNPLLTKAFEDSSAKGVVIIANSPGGTPVQAALINERIRTLKAEHADKKVVVVAEDACASGCYMVAVAADKIVANPSSIIGSIGVIARGFGFQGLMSKLGVERRTFTAGKAKNRMDPFGPLTEGDQIKYSEMLGDVHEHFIQTVTEGRKDRLRGEAAMLFSGDFWTGSRAVELGLVDKLADLPTTLKEEFGVSHVREYSVPKPFWENMTKNIGVSMADRLLQTSLNGLQPALAP